MKKVIVFCAFIIITLSCAEKTNKKVLDKGKKLFKQNCVICHGINGKLGLNESKDLTVSEMTKTERISIIKNGKGTMNAFGSILKPEEIEAIVDYTFTLK